MDFHSLARRDLQALCKLNAIPANITNVAMADALTSLDVVEGLEDFLNLSPERKAVTAAKVPRTGRRTGTVSKPIGDVSESVQPMTKSTRRTTRRAISNEIMQEMKTPAIRSSRKTVEFTKTWSEGIEDVEKKSVTDTPALATYSQRSQVACKSSVKEVSTVQRVYSTRRSARLTENKDGEEKEKKIDSLVTELSRNDLGDGLDNKNLSGNDEAEVVLQESVEKSDMVALETVNNLEDNEAFDEVNAVQEDNSTKSLVIENEKQGDVQEEIIDELGEELKQLDESQFVADEDNKGYPMDTENSHEQTKPDEAAPERGMEVKEDDAQEIVVNELKEKSEQCFNTLDESHLVHEVNANNVMIEDKDSKVEKSLMDSDNPHEQLDLGAGEEYETNKNLAAGGDSCLVEEHMTYSDESKDDILDNNDPKEIADQIEDEMDSDKSFLDEVEPSIGDSELVHHVTCFVEPKADILNNDFPKEIAGGTEISSVPPFVYLLSAPFVSSGEAENKPVTKTPSVKGLNCVSDDKENINRNGMKFEPKEEEAKKNKLEEKSLRELTKMLKEKLQISKNTAEDIGKVTKERPALQKLEDNCQRQI
ncbi:hypothetical protein POM88_045591 [Heracleum sosnowskyi]|uniref:Uncharacterized protein n=1 Tax=Heracleum sosnowskyi TaxID=360622 RepID=A0AAD8H4T2_9APIA|nr:hypothetical protein POM88_045591 [Heracleum sosnowskyi]